MKLLSYETEILFKIKHQFEMEYQQVLSLLIIKVKKKSVYADDSITDKMALKQYPYFKEVFRRRQETRRVGDTETHWEKQSSALLRLLAIHQATRG